MVDGVIVKTLAGKHELRHPHCIGGDAVEGSGPVSVAHPNRSDYKTQGGYDRAVTRAYACAGCGEQLCQP